VEAGCGETALGMGEEAHSVPGTEMLSVITSQSNPDFYAAFTVNDPCFSSAEPRSEDLESS
jgi:hypothetical protein